jgi:hypothetical protein
MLIIGQAIVEDSVRDAHFACDIEVCRGACCSLPGARGAPLEDDEALEIDKALPAAKRFLPPASIEVIESMGPVEGRPGDLATQCVALADCVFVYRDNNVAKCALERAYLEGLTDWRKPLSCHLFPIRVRPLTQEIIRYEQIPECQGGRDRGRREGTPLVAFVREALERKYGTEWYNRLHDHCEPPR